MGSKWRHLPQEDRPDAVADAPPAPPPSPFSGIGLWTASDPLAVLDAPRCVAWVAVRPEFCSRPTADALRARFRLLVWEAESLTGAAAVSALGAAGYIAQSEGPGQLAAALQLDPPPPRALVGSAPYFDAAWTSLLECYGVDVPSDLGPGFPVLGVFDGFPLAAYLPTLAGRRNFSVYLAEGMTCEDWRVLAEL